MIIETLEQEPYDIATLHIDPSFKLVSENETLTLDAVSGRQTITRSKDTFGFIHSDFEEYGLNKRADATPETPIEVYDIRRNDIDCLGQLYAGMQQHMNDMCLTQHQILNFIKKYRQWLLTDSTTNTLFLLKMDGEIFIARVTFDLSGSLAAYAYRLQDYCYYRGVSLHRMVVRQLIA